MRAKKKATYGGNGFKVNGISIVHARWKTERFEKDGIIYRVCRFCKQPKALEHYSKHKSTKIDGRMAICKPCATLKKASSKYNIEVEDLKEVWRKADYKCAICGSKKRLDVDHSHKTDKVRSILCTLCNRAIGLFREDRDILFSAISYLTKFKDV